MSYAGNYIRSKGVDCVVLRNPTIASKVSMKRSTKASRDLGAREGFWEGMMLSEAGLQSGDSFSVGTNTYLVQTVSRDQCSHEDAFFAAKTNALLNHKRFSELLDENNHIIKAWDTLHSGVPAYGEIITSRMRQEDPGLLDGARYIFKVAKSLGVQVFDRMVHGDSAFEVLSVDDIALPGVLRIQLGADVRGE